MRRSTFAWVADAVAAASAMRASAASSASDARNVNSSSGASVLIDGRSTALIGDAVSHFLRTAKFSSALSVPR